MKTIEDKRMVKLGTFNSKSVLFEHVFKKN